MKKLSCLALIMALPGCAASLRSTEVSQDKKMVDQAVDGVPYRIRDRLQVEIYRKTDKGYELVGKQMETLADPSRLYLLNFEGMPLADASVKFEQRADGTLSTVKVGGTGKAAELGTNVASGLDTLAAANQTLIEAQTKQETSAATETAQEASDALEAVRTREQVTILELQLSEKEGTLKPSEIQAARLEITLAKMKANTAAIKAGQTMPFPDPAD
jgi:hypothetical protein